MPQHIVTIERSLSILDSLSEAVLVLDAHSRIEQANAAFLGMFALSRKRVVGKAIDAVFKHEGDEEFLELLREACAQRKRIENYELEMQSGGTVRVLRLNTSPLKHDDESGAIVVSIVDVSRRVEMERALQGRIEFADKLIDSTREALVVLKGDLRIERANRRFYELFKVEPCATEGRSLIEIGNGAWDIPELRRRLEEILPGRSSFDEYAVTREFPAIGKRALSLTARRIAQLDLIILSLRDITEEVEAAGQQSEMEIRNRLIAELSDALRPLLEPSAIMMTACSALARCIGGARVGYAELNGTNRTIIVSSDGSDQMVGDSARFGWQAYGAGVWTRLRTGRTLVVDDARDDWTSNEWQDVPIERPALEPSIIVPLMRDGPRALLSVESRAPRIWTPTDVALAEEAAARTSEALERARSEAALRESEALMRIAAECATIGFWSYELSTGSFSATPEYYEIFGLPQPTGPIHVDEARRAYLPEDLDLLVADLSRSLEDGEPVSRDRRFVRPNGDIGWVHVIADSRKDQNGQAVARYGVTMDITTRRRAEDSLREREEQIGDLNRWFQATLEASQVVVFAQDLNLRYVWVHNLPLGLRPEEVVGKTTAEVFPNVDVSPVVALKRRVIATQQPIREEVELALPDGVRWYDMSVRPEFENATVVGVLCTAVDITDRKAADQALRDSEARLRLATEAAHIGIFVIDVERGVALYSEELARILGFPGLTEAAVEDAFARVHRADRERAQQAYAAALSADGDGRLAMEFRFVRPGGQVRWMTWSGQVHCRNRRGRLEPFRVVGVCIDVTERRAAEEALRSSESRLRLSQEAGKVGSWEWMVESGEVYWSAEARRLFAVGDHIDPSYAIWQGTLHPADRSRAITAAEEALDRGSYEDEYRIVRRDGSIRWVRAIGSVERDMAGGPLLMRGVVLDVTEQKSQEHQIRLLLAEVNHRAKNLLAVVQAMASQTALTSEPRHFVETLEDRLRGLSESQDLIIRGNWTAVSLEELVDSQLRFLGITQQRIDASGETVMLNPAAAQAIGMALHELATNALKYGALSVPTGKVAVRWERSGEAPDMRIAMTWTERGGPAVRQPTRRGFGQAVIEEMAAYALGGHVDLSYERRGFCWRLDVAESRMTGPLKRTD